MVTHRKNDGLDGRPSSPDHATSFHSDEWSGALSSEPLNARAQRDELKKIHTAKQSSRSAVVQTKSFLRRNPAILPGITTAVGLVAGMMARRALRRRKPLGVVIVEPKPGATAPVW